MRAEKRARNSVLSSPQDEYHESMSCWKRLIYRLALSALLLFAQQVAMAHGAAHALDHGPFQLQHAGDDGNFHSPLCAFHADFHSVLGPIESTPPALYVPDTAVERPSALFPRYCFTQPVIPASRSPPDVSSLRS